MEKQGFRFIILRVLAHQLQNLADFVSRQAGEEQTNSESADTGSETDASRLVSSPESNGTGMDVENPPAHWLAHANTAEPPADWLARVQNAAPELLKQKGFTSRNVETLSRTLPAAQPDSHSQMIEAGAGQETPMVETLQSEEDTWRPLEPVTKDEDVQSRDETHRSAPSQNILTQSPTLPSTAIVGNVPLTDARVEQRERLTEIMHAEKAYGQLKEQGKPEREGDEEQEYKTDIPASPNSVLKKHGAESVGQKREPAQISRPGTASASSPTGEWLGQPVKQRFSPWEGRRRTGVNQQIEYNAWSQAGILEPPYGQRWPRLSEADEEQQVEMRWPSLPEDAPADGQDWEIARRAWERQRRLDEEQRGSSWNA